MKEKSNTSAHVTKRKKKLTSNVWLEFTSEKLKQKIMIEGKEVKTAVEKAKCNYCKFQVDIDSSKGTSKSFEETH